MYLIKLHLQDATGEVDAALFDKDADEFFQVSSVTLHSFCNLVAQCNTASTFCFHVVAHNSQPNAIEILHFATTQIPAPPAPSPFTAAFFTRWLADAAVHRQVTDVTWSWPSTCLLGVASSCCLCFQAVRYHTGGLTALQGYPAQDYGIKSEGGSPSEACNALQQKLDALLGLHSGREGGVWMECCVKTYFIDRESPLDTCHFRVFGTRLR